MKLKNMVVFLFPIIVAFNANANPADKFTMEEIYNKMCIDCHSSNGSGNTEKLTPSMTSLSLLEIEEALLEVEDDNGHVIMEHNRGQILKRGMEYSAKEMASYMYTRFKK